MTNIPVKLFFTLTRRGQSMGGGGGGGIANTHTYINTTKYNVS